jgi:hybrid cluster-associated redox disulfide protein
MLITKDMTVGQVLRTHPQTVQIFLQLGMHCLGCPSSTMESIEGAALTHGKKPDELVEQLNQALAQN